MKRPLVVGLTGGIGSGKSAAAQMFAECGAAIVDTDAIAHALTGPQGAAMPALVQAFGPEIQQPNGALDRAAMRQRIFSSPTEKTRLESILHPMIRQESDQQVAATIAAQAPYVVLVAPLLIESGSYRQRVDRVVVVDCPEAVQIARVQARNGFTEAEVRDILVTQASRADRLAVADHVIDNSGDLSHLQQQVRELDAKLSRTNVDGA